MSFVRRLYVALVVVVTSILLASSTSFALRLAMQKSTGDCTKSDDLLLALKSQWCASIYGPPGTPTCKVTPEARKKAAKDWPSQTVYFNDILAAVAAAGPCVNTTVGRSIIEWVERDQSNITLGGTLIQTMAAPNGQLSYFMMPLPSSAPRIESAEVMGYKCWSFENLHQTWQRTLKDAVFFTLNQYAPGGKDAISNFAGALERGSTLTRKKCFEVEENCFLNTTYQPQTHNGTCSLKWLMFAGGFKWKNFEHLKKIAFPFYE